MITARTSKCGFAPLVAVAGLGAMLILPIAGARAAERNVDVRVDRAIVKSESGMAGVAKQNRREKAKAEAQKKFGVPKEMGSSQSQ